MEELPIEYTEHNMPLIFLSGLASEDQNLAIKPGQRQESGTRITAERSICEEPRAKTVLDQLLKWQGTQQPWNAVALPGPTGALKYRFRTVGRSYTLPPRKAAPLAQSPTSETPPRQNSNELHSPLSPLSPGSPIFPDGVTTPLWFRKHQYQVPALILTFFDFTLNGGPTEDNLTKVDINAVKTALGRSGFRTRFAAVLMSDRSIIQSPEMEERFSSIRRATSSDAKTGLFFMPPMPSDGEIATFIQSMLATLQPTCVEFYRELTKHARRKKSRYTVPASPVPMHAQSLSTPGWNARYEIKQAVFAEYRQEMDVAQRHYAQAIDDLCSADGFFESTPSWSPRWDETRLICDSIATRIIRCHLWNGMTVTAVQAWYEYRNIMKSLIDRKGKGTHTYGWLAWETRWARIMAHLIQLAELSMLDTVPKKGEPPVDLSEFHAYASPEKALVGSDILPAHLLHHPGYWNRLASRTARARHRSALAIPDEDKVPPGQSPASSVANRALSYDTYLVPEPHEEAVNAESDSLDVAQIAEQASQDFADKGQHRMAEYLALELAEDYVDQGLHARAMEVLAPIWDASSWREERWRDLFSQMLAVLNKCAVALKNAELALTTAWEQLALGDDAVSRTVEELDLLDTKPLLQFHNTERLSPVSVGFAFDEANAFAGEPVKCQLILRSNDNQTRPLSISKLDLSIPGVPNISIEAKGVPASQIHDVLLEPNGNHLTSTAPLIVSGVLILNFTVTFEDAGTISLQSITLKFDNKHLTVIHMIDDTALLQTAATYSLQSDQVVAEVIRHELSTQIVVQPKPPKVDIRLKSPRKQYFVGEQLRLHFDLVNAEAHNVSGTIRYAITQVDDTPVSVELSDEKIHKLPPLATFEAHLLADSQQTATQLHITATFTYALESAAHNTLMKTIDTIINVVPLLQAKWTFGPLLHADVWPSYFNPNFTETSDSPSGISQRWKAAFTAKYVSVETIVLHSASVRLLHDLHDAVCQPSSLAESETTVNTGDNVGRAFELVTRKISAEDRKPTQLNLVCNIDWSHKGDTTIYTAPIAMPRITLPSSEPRVLCTVEQANGVATVQYHLENLSTHFLTFALTMEASEVFAFSGAKYRSLSLAPLSRLTVPYRIMLHAQEEKWIYPSLQVVDSYYQKTLRVQPAGPDVKLDNKSGLAVFIRQ